MLATDAVHDVSHPALIWLVCAVRQAAARLADAEHRLDQSRKKNADTTSPGPGHAQTCCGQASHSDHGLPVKSASTIGGACVLLMLFFGWFFLSRLPTSGADEGTGSVATHATPATAASIDSGTDSPSVTNTDRSVRGADSYQVDKDLFDLYRTLSATTDAIGYGIAARILDECGQISRSSNVYRKVASGDMVVLGGRTITGKQRMAAIALVKRCEGFNGWQFQSFGVERKSIVLKLGNLQDAPAQILKALDNRVPPADDSLRIALRGGPDPFLIERLQEILLAKWAAANFRSVSDAEKSLSRVGFAIVGCRLGAPCGADSLAALVGCFFNASLCDEDFSAQQLDHLSSTDVARANDYAVMFADALKKRDPAVFGL